MGVNGDSDAFMTRRGDVIVEARGAGDVIVAVLWRHAACHSATKGGTRPDGLSRRFWIHPNDGLLGAGFCQRLSAASGDTVS